MHGSKFTQVLSASAFVGALLFKTTESSAAGEQWYMMYNCTPQNAVDLPFMMSASNAYGYHNSNAFNYAYMFCAQPHLLGNNGYTGATAKVLDRCTFAGVVVSLCRNADTGGNELCDTQISNGTSASALSLSYASQSDSTRSFYYWRVILPPQDSSGPVGGVSHFLSAFFQDN